MSVFVTNRRRVALLAFLLFPLLTNACAKASDPLDPPPQPTLVAVELTPPSASLQVGGTQQFGVIGRMSDGGTQAVTPSYSSTGGTISNSGLYTAGATAGTYRVIASASELADTATITLTAGPPPPPTLVAVELTPASVTLSPGGTQQFSVIGRLSNGGTQAVTPSYTATGGTISGSGLYSAGGTAGTNRVIAAASGLADTASVTLTGGGGGTVTLFSENFEGNPNLDARFPDRFGQHAVVSDAVCFGGSRCLEVTFPQGGTGGWLSTYYTGITSGTIRLTARIQWSAGWQGLSRVAGLKGTPAANPNAANGVAGVCANTGKNGVVDAVDPFFTAVVEIGDNGRLRFYEQYVNQNGTPPGNCFSVIGTGGGMGTATYTPAGGVAPAPGVWHLLEIEVKLNDVGQANGYHRFWLDGQQLGDFATLTWRAQGVVEFTQLQLDMHASGGSPQLQRVWWDDIVLTHTP